MKYTGERHLPWEKNAQANYEHYHRYAIALKFAKNKRVLDLASGEGYGVALLASVAQDVTGIDIDEETVSHASNRYIQNNLRFVKGAIQDIPFPDKAFDLITCFEVIEHVSEQEKVLDEALRLLTDEGLLVISTPNKRLFTDEIGQAWPWHVKEFYYSEFQHLLRSKFNDVIFLGQKLLTGSMVWPLDFVGVEKWADNDFYIQTSNENVNFVTVNQQKPMFFIAIASKQNLNRLRKMINTNHLVDVSLELLNEKNFWIDKLKDDVKTLNQMVSEKENHFVSLSTYTQAKEKEIAFLNLTIEAKDSFIQDLQVNLDTLQNDIQHRNAIISQKEFEIISLNGFIQQKEQDIRIAASFIEELHNSRIWRILLMLRRLTDKLIPTGSFQRQLLSTAVNVFKAAQIGTAQKKHSTAFSHHNVDAESRLNMDTKFQPINQWAVCTVASKNYLSQIRVFAESIKRTNPGVSIHVLLVDRIENKFDPAEESYHITTIEELQNIPNPKHFFFKYSPIELNTAVKPYFLEYLFRDLNYEKVCYFDPDTYIFSSLDGIWGLLNNNAMVVTPHITAPYGDNLNPSELEINLAGVFNLGFLALASTPSTFSFLSWWKDRLYNFCYMNPKEGMHVDQNWVNFAPVMYDGVFILRDPAYNIAYWNLHERGKRLRFVNENLYIDNRPAVFFHFSGFDPKNTRVISRHQNRFTLNDFSNIKPLYTFYKNLLEKAAYEKTSLWSYAFSRFDNGIYIPHIARSAYGKLDKAQIERFGNPFATGDTSAFIHWLNQPADRSTKETDGSLISHLHMELYNSRPDLQTAFPDPLGMDRESFKNWLQSSAAIDFGLDQFFLTFAPKNSTTPASWFLTLRNKMQESSLRILSALRNKLKEPIRKIFPENSKTLDYIRKLDRTLFFSRNIQKNTLRVSGHANQNLPFGVNVSGYFRGEFGIAEVARTSLSALYDMNIPCVLNNVNTILHRLEDPTYSEFSEENPYRFNLIHVNADQIEEFARQKGQSYFNYHHNIGYWFWELSHFPAKWTNSFAYLQEIWVASSFCQESIAAQAPIPVVKIIQPVLIDPTKVKPDRSRLGLPQDKFIYGFVFDYMSFVERKNPLAIINAFKLAFGDMEDVLLLIKTINGDQVPDQVQRLHQTARGSNIQFIDGHLARDEVINLVSSLDSYVSLHRSEGLGISMAQAMYLKKPVIATGYSGNMEFMNHNNSFLVRYQLAEIQENLGPYTKGQHWAEPDVEHAAELMRLVFDNQAHAQKIAERAEADIKANMTPKVTGSAMKERLLLLL